MSGAPPPDLVERAYRVGDAALPPVARGDRRTAIRAFGIVQIVLAGVCFLCAIGAVLSALDSASKTGWFGVLFYAVPAGNLLLTGIGSVTMNPPVRRVALFSAIAWLGPIAFGVWASKAGVLGNTGYEAVMVDVMLVVAFLLSAGSIAFYTRPTVRTTFEPWLRR